MAFNTDMSTHVPAQLTPRQYDHLPLPRRWAGRSYLKELDHSPQDYCDLLDLAAALKQAKKQGSEPQLLHGKTIALIFEKTSTRTRCAFEVAAYDQGAHVTSLDPASSHIGHKESVADTAAVLGRYYHGIHYRGFGHDSVETLAQHAGVPVWNGLTDQWHPTQSLADLLTMREHLQVLRPQAGWSQLRYAYIGDARNNVAHSALVGAAMVGADVRIVAPRSLWPDEQVVQAAQGVAATTGARITLTDQVEVGVQGVDFIGTDIWVSMGEPEQVWAQRLEVLGPYQVNEQVLQASGNAQVKFLHCLPAYHDTLTAVGRTVADQFGYTQGIEVTDAVFSSPASVVFDQAENRLHTIKAVMVATLADPQG